MILMFFIKHTSCVFVCIKNKFIAWAQHDVILDYVTINYVTFWWNIFGGEAGKKGFKILFQMGLSNGTLNE